MTKKHKTGRQEKKPGLAPGTVIHIGTQRDNKPEITTTRYNNHTYITNKTTIEEATKKTSAQGVTWININGVHDTTLVSTIADAYGIHPLVTEDIVNTAERPKIEYYDDFDFIVLKALHIEQGKLVLEHINILVGPDWVISFQETPGDIFTPIHNRLATGKGRLRAQGADYLAYALIDNIVDHYFVVLETLGDNIEALEERLLKKPHPNTVQHIITQKHELIMLQNAIRPLREILNGLIRGESKHFHKSTVIYLRDVYDHSIQVMDTVTTFREMISGMLDLYMSSVSNKMNEVMKVLTIIATIFIPLTFITGIYGMNFRYMPEINWPYGYLFSLGLMLAMALVMIYYFKKKDWL